jgi:hypothetical protein
VRRRWIIVYAAILSLAGCKATGSWSFKRDGDGFAYTCEPFPGQEYCGLIFDLDFLTFFERMFGPQPCHCPNCPPDGTSIPLPADPPQPDSPAEPSG